MPDDKGGSDLDVFEGLGKKPAAPSPSGPKVSAPNAPATIRGGFASASGAVPKAMPPPSKKGAPVSGGVALPKPSPPPSRAAGPAAGSVPAAANSGLVNLPKPSVPSKGSRAGRHSDPPEVVVGNDLSGFFAEQGKQGAVLPGGVTADLDWDDAEESTAVFDRQEHDLFENLEPRSMRSQEAEEAARRHAASAAALLKQSGGAARPVSTPPPASAPAIAAAVVVPATAPMPAATPIPTLQSMQAVAPRPSYEPQVGYAPAQGGGGKIVAVVVALVAVVALAIGGYFLFGVKKTGDITISVTLGGQSTDRAQIFVDGQKRCDFTPCVIEGLTPGRKAIRATDGTKVAQQEVAIEAGQKTQIIISLDDGKPGAPIAEPGAKATLKIASAQKGVKLFVDGVDKGELPVELTGLAPGTVKLKLVGGDAYAVTERSVELKAGEVTDLGSIALAPLKVKVTFKLETAGAKVKLAVQGEIGGDRELRFNREKEAEETLDTSKRWIVKATKKGFQDFERVLSFDDGKPEQTLTIELTEEGKEPPPVAATAPTTAPPPTGTAPPTTTATKTETPAPGGMGTLQVNSLPPSRALVDGRPVGNTPTSVQVPAGSHTVVFIHPELGRKSVSVTVGAGQTKSAAVKFKKAE